MKRNCRGTCLFMKRFLLLLLPLLILSGAIHSQAKAEELRILCYNVCNAKGMDNKFNLDRTAAVINAFKPDLVALQELDRGAKRTGQLDILQELAKRTGMTGTYGKAIDFQGGAYGIGILSRQKPLSFQSISLPGREEKRCLLMVEFEKYIFMCTHFSLTEEDRISSAQLINKAIQKHDKIIFLAGDLNAKPESEPIRLLSSVWTRLTATEPTWPADQPDRCIDYILAVDPTNRFSKDAESWKKATVQQGVIPESAASDHRPVYVILKRADLNL